MRLYTRAGATTIDDPEYGHFDASPDGGFDLPEDLALRLHAFHIGGQPAWETDLERQRRLMTEELDRRRDPANLLAAVEQIINAGQLAATATATPAVKTGRGRTAKSATPPAA